ncbi:hypothetical protein [Amycolatopsis sp. WAC 04197]|uniref:hypothetical protein n=1 Tax=unclassified Amycolatopsis TaxID=2618356 RepID=UPI000F7985AD|nr:hypothetical protein [Amycolatopsis sp. WAC 04197]RSN44932.1 hypothetical protein DMC64_18805 [Amycolatopsis sp. WAC 04197]
MSVPLVTQPEKVAASDERLEVAELAALVAETVPVRNGLDRMTPSRLEEFLTPVALTAHL